MDTSDFDLAIAKHEEQDNNIREQMEKVLKDFLGATCEFVADWYQNTVERTVVENAGVTQSLGVNGLRVLKADLQELLKKVPEVAAEHLDRDSYWPHRSDKPAEFEMHFAGYHVASRRRLPGSLDEPVRRLLGLAGNLLTKRGFARREKESEWEARIGVPGLRFRYAYEPSTRMLEVLRRYSELYDSLVETRRRLEEVRWKKTEAQAKALWDEA